MSAYYVPSIPLSFPQAAVFYEEAQAPRGKSDLSQVALCQHAAPFLTLPGAVSSPLLALWQPVPPPELPLTYTVTWHHRRPAFRGGGTSFGARPRRQESWVLPHLCHCLGHLLAGSGHLCPAQGQRRLPGRPRRVCNLQGMSTSPPHLPPCRRRHSLLTDEGKEAHSEIQPT